MKLISENIHIISKRTKEAILNRDEIWIRNLIAKQIETNPNWIDLNIGPAKRNFEGSMKWLTKIVSDLTDIPLSFDSTNIKEIEDGLSFVTAPENCIINSTSADAERLEAMTDLAAKYNSNLVALTLNKEIGIPKFADQRLELAFQIIETCGAKGIANKKIFFDPLILPVCVEQTQAVEAMSTIRMLKESFDPQTLTTIGLSNVSNGCPAEIRGLINRTFFVMAAGCGLDSAIVDSFDSELLRINKVLETGVAEKDVDKLYLNLFEMCVNFGELSDIEYNKESKREVDIFKTAQILLNEKVYTNSYLDI